MPRAYHRLDRDLRRLERTLARFEARPGRLRHVLILHRRGRDVSVTAVHNNPEFVEWKDWSSGDQFFWLRDTDEVYRSADVVGSGVPVFTVGRANQLDGMPDEADVLRALEQYLARRVNP